MWLIIAEVGSLGSWDLLGSPGLPGHASQSSDLRSGMGAKHFASSVPMLLCKVLNIGHRCGETPAVDWKEKENETNERE
jgi:hypothetical protein